MFWLFLAPAGLMAQVRGDRLPTLTTARAVHQLTVAEARRAYPIKLHAIVTYYDPYLDYPQPILIVTDATGSIFVKLPLKSALNLNAGQLVEVHGQSVPGGFAPDVDLPKVRVLGESSWPRHVPLRTLTDLLTGSEDAPLVEMEGVIHSVQQSAYDITLRVAGSDGGFSAVTPKVAGVDYSHLVDERVRIRGIACSLFNKRRQIVGVQLRFAGLAMLTVVSPAQERPFDLPVTPVSLLLTFRPGKPSDRLVHLQGIVTLFWPGRLLCIQDGSEGLCAQTAQTDTLVPGQAIDVIGFPQIGNYTPTLADARYRTSLGQTQTTVSAIAADETLHGQHDAQLVQIEGQLIGQDRGADDPTIILSSGRFIFSASLPRSSDAADLLQLEQGSRLKITGICSVQADLRGSTDPDGYKVAKSMRILLRTTNDLMVLQRPSWWNAAHTLRVLIFALVSISGVLVWVLILRKRLEKQAERLQFQSTHDGLTGLWNRQAILDFLVRECELAARSQSVVGIMMLDADHFKRVNDTYGHMAGDAVLRAIAERIGQSVRSTDLIGRYGGEEFLVVLPGGDEQLTSMIAERVRLAIADQPIHIDETELFITISIGASVLEHFSLSERDAALEAADNALYESKHCGRNRVTFELPRALLLQPIRNLHGIDARYGQR
jgi:diguanylate cyclase (GGDEF)-like protein